MDRAILHIRIDSFFAEAERNRRPELAGKPVIVARPKGNTSGVVVSASHEAIKLGVVEGMSVRHAKRSCPDAVVISADNDSYRQLFERFLDILVHCSPLVEPAPPNGAFLDVTASRRLFGDPVKIGRRIAVRVWKKLGLAASIGCASNKLVAEIASTLQDGPNLRSIAADTGGRYVSVCRGFEDNVISTCPVTVLGSVNSRIARQLGDLGVTTVGQLAMIPETLLIRRFGPVGSVMRKQSLGIDMSPVRAAYPPDIIISEHMCDAAMAEPPQIEEYLSQLTGEAVAKLRKKCLLAGEVALKLFDESERSAASYFRFKKPTDSAATMQQALTKMLHDKMQPGMEIYRVQMVLSQLTPGESSQLCLIGDGERRNRINRAADLIRERFGEGAIFTASSLAAKGKARVLGRIAA